MQLTYRNFPRKAGLTVEQSLASLGTNGLFTDIGIQVPDSLVMDCVRLCCSLWQAHAAHSEPYEAKEKGYSEAHRSEPPAGPAPAAVISDRFVASKNSEVFHRADCKSAAKISAKNLVR